MCDNPLSRADPNAHDRCVQDIELQSDPKSVHARFRSLAAHWGVFLPDSARYRRLLRLSPNDLLVLTVLVSHYHENNFHDSVAQAVLADELGIARSSLNGQLTRLRRSGLVAVRGDPRYGTPTSTLRYCLHPYLAVVALLAGQDRSDDSLWSDGASWLTTFLREVASGRWVWRFGILQTPPLDAITVASAFVSAYELPTTFIQDLKVSEVQTEVDSY